MSGHLTLMRPKFSTNQKTNFNEIHFCSNILIWRTTDSQALSNPPPSKLGMATYGASLAKNEGCSERLTQGWEDVENITREKEGEWEDAMHRPTRLCVALRDVPSQTAKSITNVCAKEVIILIAGT